MDPFWQLKKVFLAIHSSKIMLVLVALDQDGIAFSCGKPVLQDLL